jgi:hypothetical protein
MDSRGRPGLAKGSLALHRREEADVLEPKVIGRVDLYGVAMRIAEAVQMKDEAK